MLARMRRKWVSEGLPDKARKQRGVDQAVAESKAFRGGRKRASKLSILPVADFSI
jgi:hypothetical protein